MEEEFSDQSGRTLRRGWTTGACAAAAAKAACAALLSGNFPDPVAITLPGGQTPAFALAGWERGEDFATASIVKDAGDDPDVTHGALIRVTIRRHRGNILVFRAGEGVGMVTRAGLPVPPGEPAINPMPRRIIAQALADVTDETGFEIEIAVENGRKIAEKTLNGRLGIIGGLSILGTTGIVIPYSCSSWIHSIYRGIDVARAAGLDHVSGATGNISEKAAQALHGLPETALIDMGDFAGGMLKYLRRHPVSKVTIAGGMAKMTKLAQGRLDLHSRQGMADLVGLSTIAAELGADATLCASITAANTVAEVFALCAEADLALADEVAARAWVTAASVLDHEDIALEVLIFDRTGNLLAQTPFEASHHARFRNRR
ncbi:cobalt-precorrin-5B (C(1))-methyltransferase [Limoniibacter endophyticus]|uniref:Cobalt-precorrin-5B C(1)-methyltransferase n=1 Tax=Limoniibacter endophyticus TaxID=1565040 RepID=A0A8J3DSQ3_9HYPH|nr:cobalt-precorrin-5B (C(1))-methyltransferase [Limoniibacter endophyticus]GHC78476.1 cobalt-precorrin-5B C(1)-methyltransferase [Limoniibacter endophyticus]